MVLHGAPSRKVHHRVTTHSAGRVGGTGTWCLTLAFNAGAALVLICAEVSKSRIDMLALSNDHTLAYSA